VILFVYLHHHSYVLNCPSSCVTFSASRAIFSLIYPDYQLRQMRSLPFQIKQD
jgi:hypothetical protein